MHTPAASSAAVSSAALRASLRSHYQPPAERMPRWVRRVWAWF